MNTVQQHIEALLTEAQEAVRQAKREDLKLLLSAISAYRAAVALQLAYERKPLPPPAPEDKPEGSAELEDLLLGGGEFD